MTHMTPLRKKMIRELELQRKADGTVKSYVRSVAELAVFHGKSPDLLEIEEVRDFVHYLIVGKKLSIGTVNQMLTGIKFLYGEADCSSFGCCPKCQTQSNHDENSN